jgi:hypothetical protein
MKTHRIHIPDAGDEDTVLLAAVLIGNTEGTEALPATLCADTACRACTLAGINTTP